MHYEIARTQVAALNSTLWSYVCAAIDGRNLEDGNSVERIDQASSAGYRRIRNRITRTRRRRAQRRCPPPDARTQAGALNAPDASPPNTQVTGGVIWNRHSSHRSFCSLPAERPRACQGAGNKDGTSNQDPLETFKVSALGIVTVHGVRPSTEQGSFLGTCGASTDNTITTPPDPPLYRTSMRPLSQHKMAHREECRGTRNHHQAIKT